MAVVVVLPAVPPTAIPYLYPDKISSSKSERFFIGMFLERAVLISGLLSLMAAETHK